MSVKSATDKAAVCYWLELRFWLLRSRRRHLLLPAFKAPPR